MDYAPKSKSYLIKRLLRKLDTIRKGTCWKVGISLNSTVMKKVVKYGLKKLTIDQVSDLLAHIQLDDFVEPFSEQKVGYKLRAIIF